ncbi:MAG: ketoacyl-ACP synthase III [Kurthia sp.]|nr:ketoacyl-ACP synthase III [Candidatus Kurthia equi]
MNIGIKIVEVATYHPSNLVDNDFYIEHFKKQDKDVTRFLDFLGREKRYIINNDENSITMAIEASKRALVKANLKGEDIDMILLSTHAPEYTVPTNVAFLHEAIGAKNHTIIFDMNANCAGMTIAVETASRYMMSNKRVKRALVVGSDANSLITNPEQEITYANFADGAAAVILEKTEDGTIGFIDAVHEVDSTNKNNILYPPQGFSKTSLQKEYINFLPFDGAMAIPQACKMIEELLADNDLTIDSVNALCFSQFALPNILKIQEHFNIDIKKNIYVGDKVGYTTTSSPFFCLNDGIETGRIKRGDIVLFWTIGAGHEMVAMLFKY